MHVYSRYFNMAPGSSFGASGRIGSMECRSVATAKTPAELTRQLLRSEVVGPCFENGARVVIQDDREAATQPNDELIALLLIQSGMCCAGDASSIPEGPPSAFIKSARQMTVARDPSK